MNSKRVFRGQLNTQVELFSISAQSNEVGETVKTPVSYGVKMVSRSDGEGDEELDGRLISLSVCKYIMRYDATLLQAGTKYYVSDIDGNWDVHNVKVYGPNRKEFIELKCSKRG